CAIDYLFAAFFFQAEDGIRAGHVTGVQTCALPILSKIGTYLDVPIFDTESAAAFDMGMWPPSAGARANKPFDLQGLLSILATQRSEERRVGKECGAGWSP